VGFYLNPSNLGFAESLRSEIYVDKSELISYTNKVLNTKQKFICISRPRRFGKTMAAEMLVAYYSRGNDSHDMFANLKIGKNPSYSSNLNQYNVIFLNIQQFLSEFKDIDNMFSGIKDALLEDINEIHPNFCENDNSKSLTHLLKSLFRLTQIPFVLIIDEWDCIFREYQTDKTAQKQYLDNLRNLLKDQQYIALTYMTGILPIHKYGTHSALNMFDEFSMTDPSFLSEYTGFTESEVKELCIRYQIDSDEMAFWYDGYKLMDKQPVYNPRSVVTALLRRRFNNYWTKTETYEALKIYVEMNFEGLKDSIIELLAGGRKKININRFVNDMVTFADLDDVLTLLVHLGYLGYDIDEKEVFIPNKEICDEFVNAVEGAYWDEIVQTLKKSDELLKATWRGDEKTVARCIETSHMDISYLKYSDENSLSCVISLAYYSARQYYTIVREMPTGEGFADLVFLPRKNHLDKPAMIIELKWDKSAGGAIKQIENRKYPEALHDFKGNILLVGINYDKKSKSHKCKIKRLG